MTPKKGIRRAFINPILLDEYGDDFGFEEGCLSIPDVRAEIIRPEKLTLEYYDENWNLKEEEFSGMTARVIQHEYDHLEGILFVDYLKGLEKKDFPQSKLIDISKGKVPEDYRMIYHSQMTQSSKLTLALLQTDLYWMDNGSQPRHARRETLATG